MRPVVIEHGLPITDQRPTNFHHRIVPVPTRLAGLVELIGNAHASDEGAVAVHHQQFAVIAEEIAAQCAELQRVVERQFDAVRPQTAAVGSG